MGPPSFQNSPFNWGPGKGEQHILTLQQLAREAGVDAPFYSVTGWDDAAVPSRQVIPVFGGYPDGLWYRSLAPLPPARTTSLHRSVAKRMSTRICVRCARTWIASMRLTRSSPRK